MQWNYTSFSSRSGQVQSRARVAIAGAGFGSRTSSGADVSCCDGATIGPMMRKSILVTLILSLSIAKLSYCLHSALEMTLTGAYCILVAAAEKSVVLPHPAMMTSVPSAISALASTKVEILMSKQEESIF